MIFLILFVACNKAILIDREEVKSCQAFCSNQGIGYIQVYNGTVMCFCSDLKGLELNTKKVKVLKQEL